MARNWSKRCNSASEILTRSGGVDGALRAARRAFERAGDKAAGDGANAALAPHSCRSGPGDARNRGGQRAHRAFRLQHRSSIQPPWNRLSNVFFRCVAIARKHGVAVGELPVLYRRFRADLDALDADGAGIAQLKAAEATARTQYHDAARSLSASRRAAAARLDAAVGAELPPLKLERAVFPNRSDGAARGRLVGSRRGRCRF